MKKVFHTAFCGFCRCEQRRFCFAKPAPIPKKGGFRNAKAMVISVEELKLCESDYRFMLILWEHAPMSSRELVELCTQNLGWKKSTTYTVLKKLCERGFVQNVDKMVSVLIPREKVQKYESERFVERTFEGSLPKFLVSFLGNKTISQKEAAELKRLIDEHQEG